MGVIGITLAGKDILIAARFVALGCVGVAGRASIEVPRGFEFAASGAIIGDESQSSSCFIALLGSTLLCRKHIVGDMSGV